MSAYLPGTYEHVALAIDHHKALIENAKRYRAAREAQHRTVERPLRWRRIRRQLGELLIYMGQRLKPEMTDTAWG